MPDFGRWTGNGGDPSLNEINRDERFLDALATNQPVYATDQSEAELAFLLSDWRDEIRDTPVTTVVTVRDAEIAMHGAVGEVSRKRTRTSLALVGSVAAAVLCLGGFSAAVYGAGPGDSFYGIRTMLFGEAPARDDQVALASQQLAQVQQLIDQGDWQQAQDKLVTLSTTVQGVDQVERKQELIQQWNALTYKVVEQDPAATLPPPDQPQPVLPSSPLTLLPVPVIEATTTSTSTSDTPTSDTSVSDTSTSISDTSSSSETTQPSDVTSTTATPTTSTEPPTTTTSEPPTSTSTSTTTSTSPSSTTTTTTTTITRQLPEAPPSSASALPPVVAPPVNVPPPASVTPPVIAEPPASQPRLAVTPTQAPPAVTQPPPAATQAPSAPKQAEEPSQTVKPSEAPSAPREGGGVVTTTTIVVPPAGRGN
jgi:hypothetical protein